MLSKRCAGPQLFAPLTCLSTLLPPINGTQRNKCSCVRTAVEEGMGWQGDWFPGPKVHAPLPDHVDAQRSDGLHPRTTDTMAPPPHWACAEGEQDDGQAEASAPSHSLELPHIVKYEGLGVSGNTVGGGSLGTRRWRLRNWIITFYKPIVKSPSSGGYKYDSSEA